jgi:hypothetical protein
MNRHTWMAAALSGGVAAGALASPAAADDGAAVVAKIDAALAAQTAFVSTTRFGGYPAHGIASTMTVTVVRPVRAPASMRFQESGVASIGFYLLGRRLYISFDGHWETCTLSDQQAQHVVGEFAASGLPADVPVTIEPDRREGAVTYGVVRYPMATLQWQMTDNGNPVYSPKPPGPTPSPQYKVCLYDKATALPHRCSGGGITTVYDRYGDPSLSVPLPREAAMATPREPAEVPLAELAALVPRH